MSDSDLTFKVVNLRQRTKKISVNQVNQPNQRSKVLAISYVGIKVTRPLGRVL